MWCTVSGWRLCRIHRYVAAPIQPLMSNKKLMKRNKRKRKMILCKNKRILRKKGSENFEANKRNARETDNCSLHFALKRKKNISENRTPYWQHCSNILTLISYDTVPTTSPSTSATKYPKRGHIENLEAKINNHKMKRKIRTSRLSLFTILLRLPVCETIDFLLLFSRVGAPLPAVFYLRSNRWATYIPTVVSLIGLIGTLPTCFSALFSFIMVQYGRPPTVY